MLEISITKLDTSSSRASKHHKTNQQPETAKSKRKNPIWPKWQTRPISLLIARVGGQKARIENSIQKILEIFILTAMVIYQQADRQTDRLMLPCRASELIPLHKFYSYESYVFSKPNIINSGRICRFD